ncbi:hypothetical protein [Ruegeria halocynthiae]|uniref:hypothetical protein n=1 Tax=Ruegeria halocynthiae TaxID=985054 RepID=UPI00056D5428|nr:hypothetical protein [Ruegeria halocynthiae]
MKPVLNRILPLGLSLLVILTGQGVAASRGMNRAVGQMVLCTGSGPVVVYSDAEGQPTKAPHFCPEYAVNLLGAVIVAALAVPHTPRTAQPAPLRCAGNLIALPVPRRPARAPPVLI